MQRRLLPMARFFLTLLLVGAVAGSGGCNRRDWQAVAPSPAGVQAVHPVASMPILSTAVPEAATGPSDEAVVVPPDPLWDELDKALDDLDAALADIETWEVEVP